MFQFLSKYIYYMDAFLSEKIIEKIDVQYADEYCLPYIALVCFKFFCDDKIDINELLKFKIDKYEHFQKFISHYKLLEQILIEFEEKVTPLLNNNKFDNNLFIKLIIKIDYDGKFYPKLNENKNEVLESGNFNEIYIESSKENDLNSTKANSDKKESPKNNTNSEEKMYYENKIGEIDKDMNSSIKIDLNENPTIKKIEVNYNSLEGTNKKNLMRKETENNINENINDEIKELKIELSVLRIKSDFEIIEVRLNSIEIKEYIKNWNIIHSEYIIISNKKIEYLEKYYKSLKNIIINLSNPYNLNFWRKISKIISQKKVHLILAKLKKAYILQLCPLYSKNFGNLIDILEINNEKKYRRNLTESKNRKINKKLVENEEISNKKTINIKGNSVPHNKHINKYINSIIEKNEIKIKNKLNNGKGIKVTNNLIKLNNEKNIEQSNELTNKNKIKEEKINETVEEKNENNQIKKNKKIDFNKKHEGKTEFNGSELIEMLENPLKFQQKIIKINDLFDLAYKYADEYKKEIEYDDKFEKLFKIEEEYENLIVRINKSLIEIENFFEKNYGYSKIDIQAININEINNSNFKEIYNIYIQLNKYKNDINMKINDFAIKTKNIKNIKQKTANNENNINKLIKQIEEEIKKESELFSLKDIFDKYKEELTLKLDEENNDYLNYKDIFSKENIEAFTFDNLISFLKKQLIIKNINYSITKRDITNFNLYVEIITNFNEFKEFKESYQSNIDLEI